MSAGEFRTKKSAASLVRSLYRDEHAPMSAMIEVADRCNETCVHCYQIQGQKGELETDDWRAIMDELASLGVVFLTISGGEATLRHDFLDLVAYARERRFAVKLFTNGLSMTREMAQALGELAVQEVQISLYSHRASVHDGVTCVPGSFDKTVAGARHLVDAGLRVVLKSPMMAANEGEQAEYAAFVTSLGCDFTMDPHVDPREDGDRSPESLRVSDATYVEATRAFMGEAARPPEPKPLEQSLCGACSGSIHIEANGEIRPCTQLPVPVGHAIDDGVAASWHGDATGKAIRSVTWADLPMCRRCDLRDYCSRCFANARFEVGDALAPYRTACHHAALQYEVVHGEAPAIAAGPGRKGAEVGPYRALGGGGYESFQHRLTAEDHDRVEAHPWSRAETNLVQVRRKQPKTKKTTSRVRSANRS